MADELMTPLLEITISGRNAWTLNITNEPITNSLIVPKVFSQQKKRYYITLGTSVINNVTKFKITKVKIRSSLNNLGKY